PGGSETIRLRLCSAAAHKSNRGDGARFFSSAFSTILEARKQEAGFFYDAISPAALDEDGRLVMRQALAGMLWSKQHYFFDLQVWLSEHNTSPSEPGRVRNTQWFHMLNDDVISMPDKWEYPWYAAWDLAFHTVALATVDLDFAKHQL